MKAKLENPGEDEAMQAFEHALNASHLDFYDLRLYVTGSTPRSIRAIGNIKRICEKYLQGRYKLEIIDIYQQPILATSEQIIAAPTLVKKLPLPLRRLIGDMSDTNRIILSLNLDLKEEDGA